MRVHFIAIGGAVMHNIAINLAEQGHQISGSDDQIVEPSRSRLFHAGLLPDEMGWFPEKINNDLDAIILGMHAMQDNPELKKAQELGLKIYSYPEFICEQSEDKLRVVIAGTYGKTTITSMVMHVLKKLGRDFDYLVGAQLDGFDSMVKLTSSAPLIVLEGDEFYSSSIDKKSKFHYYKPNIALISGVEWDSFKTVISEEDYFEQFRVFIESIEPKGTLIYNKDNLKLAPIIEETKALKINRHGYKIPEHTINKGITYVHVGEEQIPLQVFGKHNLSNIAGAYTLCEWLGVKRDEFYEAIKDFKSSIRHLEFVGSSDGSVVYQDFAHTPVKVKQSIHAVKEQFPNQALVTVIELKAYDVLDSGILDQYRHSMNESDQAIVYVNLHTIKEKSISAENIESRLAQAFDHPSFYVLSNVEMLERFLENFRSSGHNLLFMSAISYSDVNLASFADKFLRNT